MPSPSDATRTLAFRPPRETPTDREPFFRRPGRVPATFTLVGSMAGTRIFAPMVRPSRNAVDGRPVAPFPDRRLNRRQTVVHLP